MYDVILLPCVTKYMVLIMLHSIKDHPSLFSEIFLTLWCTLKTPWVNRKEIIVHGAFGQV